MNKYYFICALIGDKLESIHQNFATGIHPFIIQHNKGGSRNPGKSFVIISWQEITKEEYELFIKLNG